MSDISLGRFEQGDIDLLADVIHDLEMYSGRLWRDGHQLRSAQMGERVAHLAAIRKKIQGRMKP